MNRTPRNIHDYQNQSLEALCRIADRPSRSRRNVRVALGGSLALTPATAAILETIAAREGRAVDVIASALIEQGVDLVDVVNNDAELHFSR